LPEGLLFSPGFSSPSGLLLFAKEVAVRHWEAFGGQVADLCGRSAIQA